MPRRGQPAIGQIACKYFFERQLIPLTSKSNFSQLNNTDQLELLEGIRVESARAKTDFEIDACAGPSCPSCHFFGGLVETSHFHVRSGPERRSIHAHIADSSGLPGFDLSELEIA